MDATISISKAVIRNSRSGVVPDRRGCVLILEDESNSNGIFLHYADRAALARFARLLCGLAGVQMVEAPAEVEEARLATRDFIDADEGRPDEDRERTQAEDWR